MIVQFRYHRGSLIDSLNTSLYFEDVESMLKFLYDKFDYIRLSPYSNRPDPRCGWDYTNIVLSKLDNGGEYPIGFYTEF